MLVQTAPAARVVIRGECLSWLLALAMAKHVRLAGLCVTRCLQVSGGNRSVRPAVSIPNLKLDLLDSDGV